MNQLNKEKITKKILERKGAGGGSHPPKCETLGSSPASKAGPGIANKSKRKKRKDE